MCRKMVSYQLLENKPCICYIGGGEEGGGENASSKKLSCRMFFSSSDRKALEKMAVSG